jgi:hypothetical protein
VVTGVTFSSKTSIGACAHACMHTDTAGFTPSPYVSHYCVQLVVDIE